MKSYIICLANSFKHHGRCVAGIEILLTSNGYTIVKNEWGIPKWIRPVSRNDAGEISTSLAKDFHIFDILAISDATCCPEGSHQENVFYTTLANTGMAIAEEVGNLDAMCDRYHKEIFFNHWKAIPHADFYNGNYSLMLIVPKSVNIFQDETFTRYPKFRATFKYRSVSYNLPITDPQYTERLKINPDLQGDRSNLYFVLSLGIDHEDWHYKLIACVIDLADRRSSPVQSIARVRIHPVLETVDNEQYVVGQSYDMKIERIETVSTSDAIYYKLAINGHRLHVYDFERSTAYQHRTIKCIYNGIGKRGEMSFVRDRAAMLADLYVQQTVYRFISKGTIGTDNDGKSYFSLRDNYGVSHRYYGTLTSKQQEEGAVVDLFVEGIDTEKGILILKPAPVEHLKAWSLEQKRMEHANAYAKWTPEDDVLLGKLFDSGMSVSELMKRFDRNRGSIESRLRKIGKK